jgi:8-oxo-dGTP diphosphatase
VEDRVKAQTDGVDALAPIRAAGGVVWRPVIVIGPTVGNVDTMLEVEVLLVHRPRHDDWTLPKGKLDPGELPLLAAVREVWEETAIRPVVGARLPTVHYDVWSKGSATTPPALVEKLVDYWAMRVGADDGFVPGHETDVRAWLSVVEGLARLTYHHDAKVLTAFSELPPLRYPVVLLRHGSAGRRSSSPTQSVPRRRQQPGDDSARPLDPSGLARAEELVAPLRCFAPSALIAATPERCAQTLRPLAQALRLPVRSDPVFDDGAEPHVAARRLHEMSEVSDGSVVVCGQGQLIPAALSVLTGRPPSVYRTAKGDGWVLSFSDKGLAAIDALPA